MIKSKKKLLLKFPINTDPPSYKKKVLNKINEKKDVKKMKLLKNLRTNHCGAVISEIAASYKDIFMRWPKKKGTTATLINKFYKKFIKQIKKNEKMKKKTVKAKFREKKQ